ncbi:DEAD/DEAH box helicase [Desulfosoma caldarium]|uniref:ATP-dependent RNA helicase RhlB n=1 Tax=Desulfosoma caldarium TaxID=610254 RepID=A0A3N1VJI6_9BACT|nr:DEAD/DEAH box helicase [Desulfosoma caldarium]ROR02974.1 ATP-dependent RNA helicase RhlB [Desulfosoma caldarium]
MIEVLKDLFQRILWWRRRDLERVPHEVSRLEPDTPEPRKAREDLAAGMAFVDLDLSPLVLRGLHEAGFVRCTPIQEKSLPMTLQGQDIAAQAQTGSGKTAVFLITIFENLLKKQPLSSQCHALVLAPTRELALQIQADGRMLGRYCPFRFAAIYGGVGYEKQIQALRQGAHIVIATPGRLIDLMKQGHINTDHVSLLVIDEADRMLDMGFVKDLQYILKRLPPYHYRQSMLFSATLSPRVLEITYPYMNAPVETAVEPERLVVKTVKQELFHVAEAEKFSLLLGLLEREKPNRVLLFCNTKVRTLRLAERLTANGYVARGITGDLPQSRRLQLLERFKGGKIAILVATDVASRGLHVEDVTHVINYDVPQDPEEYVHRIGRTARAGKEGKAITLCGEDDVYALENVEKFLGQKIPVIWPEEDWFVPDRADKGAPRRPSRGRRAEAAKRETVRARNRGPRTKKRGGRGKKKAPFAAMGTSPKER